MKRFFILLLIAVFCAVPVFVFGESMFSPTWGFLLDLPEGYVYFDGDGRDRFSFSGPGDSMFDLVIYNGTYSSIRDMANDVTRRIGNRGDVDFFLYRDKQAAIIQLNFNDYSGWGLCVSLASDNQSSPMLLALAYGPAGISELDLLHVSALDSICPGIEERYYPGPIIEYSFPRGEIKNARIASAGVNVMIRENDAEAAQVLIEREFNILKFYADTPLWKEAWIRYYRFVYRDSFDRVSNAASALALHWGADNLSSDEAKRAFAQRALTFVQNFKYERFITESDFLNLVTAVTEERGDCDSHSMLWAIILNHAGIRSALMVSPHFGHAMGLADVAGAGARFEHFGTRWLVAETTDKIDIGLIAQEQSDPNYWIGILLD